MDTNINYKPFFKLLIDLNMKTSTLIKDGILSRSTLFKMKKNEYISLNILVKLCIALNCTLDNLVEIIRSN
ncbi:helix-turn-helix domain-containing protein [Clostridium coskatii]|uniref:HTH cro/C1-type domain-containing protein n=1 Tax=Clostridium coskatii TaxID=1705578 RepID=A0A162KZI3_9CLOT|nr:helix-turn-helix transcriptional regulator [Clostridium coskatii]OAA86338.1 hypothetical protein WX73_02832 [Clostridium coskatii]OAA86356.1 hypothetical protein WX73_02850 [Clostridium coskatii]OBR95077.1 hypothetical protein CLCOS_17820 [Clostridium coskatii]